MNTRWTTYEHMMKHLWTHCEQMMNTFCTNYAPFMKKLWTTDEQTMNKRWTIYEQLMIKIWTNDDLLIGFFFHSLDSHFVPVALWKMWRVGGKEGGGGVILRDFFTIYEETMKNWWTSYEQMMNNLQTTLSKSTCEIS